MQENIETLSKKELAARGRAGFLVSVTVSAGIFTIIIATGAIVRGWESSTEFSWITKAEHFVTMMVMMFAIGWVWAFLHSIIPYFLGFTIAKWMRELLTGWFFISGAVGTALLLAPIAGSIPNFGFNVQGDIHEISIAPNRILRSIIQYLRFGSGHCLLACIAIHEKMRTY
ncbi:MAG: hypothetical protein AB9872_09815 [Solidesulfovibrio sp.]